MDNDSKTYNKGSISNRSKSRSSSKSSSSSSGKRHSSSGKSKSQKVFPITESRKLPKFPKNAVFPDSEYAKSERRKNTHNALNPIVVWPSSRIDQTAPDLNIGCNDMQLPQKVRTRLLELRNSDIKCKRISLKANGTYVIEGSNGNHYVMLSTSGFGKNKYSKKNRSKKNKKTRKIR